MWSIHSEAIQNWSSENHYTSHQFVTEVIDIMGLFVLRSVSKRMKECSGSQWFCVIANEATDIDQAEQLNLSICWVDIEYQAHKDPPVGLFRVPDTNAVFKVIKDLVIRCDLPFALGRGKAYDGASNMQGRRTGVATRVCCEQPAAVPMHCCAHSLNLWLQDAGQKLTYIRDALEVSSAVINIPPNAWTCFFPMLIAVVEECHLNL